MPLLGSPFGGAVWPQVRLRGSFLALLNDIAHGELHFKTFRGIFPRLILIRSRVSPL